jgi:ribosomal-protein-alanine N-acetyltransferase
MTAGKIRVRHAQMTDIRDIVTIEQEAFPDPWSEETFVESLAIFPSTFFIAENGQMVAGFVASGMEDTGEELYGHIMNIAVAHSYRRRGIGRMLVRRIEHQFLLQGASGIQLEVRQSNIRAQQFYRELGYEQVIIIAGYYNDGEDAIVMMKWFMF